MRKLIALLFVFISTSQAFAQSARQEIDQNPLLVGTNYYAYPTPNVKITPAPAGYKPFYISTYARHGSRFLINGDTYKETLTILQDADKKGKLSALGKETLMKVDSITRMSKDRLGELTPLGARQHRGIALRMYQNYPEVFAGNAEIDARSSTIIRCILSMNAESLQLQALNPKLRFTNDASASEMFYLAEHDKSLYKYRDLPKALTFKDDLYQQYIQPERLMSVLFNDSQYVANEIHQKRLMDLLFDIARNMQSHDVDLDLLSLFSKQERYDLWKRDNLRWYVNYGPSPLSRDKMPYMVTALLENILNVANTSVKKKENSASLRFGHESLLLPLAALLELNDVGKQSTDPEEIVDFWRNYKIFPMASNIQFVFFRNPKSPDILVKVLLNEHEAKLPVNTQNAPFYKWTEVEAYYRTKLNDFQKESPSEKKEEKSL